LKLLGSLIRVGELFGGIAVDSWRSAVQCEAINADGLRLSNIRFPVIDRIMLDDAEL
jgi:hypothetical protein